MAITEAWTSAALESYETARLALDKPLVAAQAIPVSPSYAKWVDDGQYGADDLSLWTDRSDSDYPALRAYDGYPGFITKPDGATADDTYYYMLDLGAKYTFDCAFLIGCNAGSEGVTSPVVIAVADDNDFSTNLTAVASFGTPTDDSRMADLALTNERISARFILVQFIIAAGDASSIEIGELILGRRRQLEYCPDRPFNRYAKHNEVTKSTTLGGVIHKTVWYRNQFMLSADMVMDSSDYIDDWVDFFEDSRGSFVWIHEPNSAPLLWHLIDREPDDLEMENVAPSVYRVGLAGMEQGPSEYFLANE